MKRLLQVLYILLCILILSFPVHAHPGRTDSEGGHTDHNTGQYHYHHGQPAHQHYDIDGNGALDCPLTFDSNSHNSQSPTVGIAAASCVGLAVTAGALTKPKKK